MHRPLVKHLPALVISVILFYWRILLTRQFSLLTDTESVNQAYSWFTFWISSLRTHTLPLWDPYMFGGRSFAGEMQTAAFYPLHLLLALAPLNRHGLLSPQLYHVYYAFAHLMAACFMFALIREFKLGHFAALLGSLCFALGGFVGRVVWPHLLESSVWLPLAMLLLLRALRAERMLRCLTYAAGTGMVLGMAILAGGLHVAMMQPIAIVSVAIFSAVQSEDGGPSWRRVCLVLAVSLVVGCSAGAVQLLPSMEYSARAIRFIGATALPATERIPYAYLRDGLFANGLMMFLMGAPSGAGGAGEIINPYMGVVPMLLAVVAIWKCWALPFVRYFAGLALAAFLFSLGSFSFLHGVIYAMVPFLWMAREAGRFVYLADFGLAMLAAFGAELVFTNAARSVDWAAMLRALRWVAIACGVALAVPALFGKVDLSPWTAFSLILICAACLLFRNAVLCRGSLWMRALAIGFILFDLSAFDWSSRNKIDVARTGVDQLDRLVSCEGAAAFLRSRPGPFRVQVLGENPPNIGDAFGLQTLNGGAVTYPMDYLGFLSLGDRAFDLLNVRYVLRPASASEARAIYVDSAWKVYENSQVLPRAWLVHEAVVEPSPERAVARLAGPAVSPRLTAFTRDPLETPLQAVVGAEDAKIERYAANDLEVSVTAQSTGLLVLGEVFYPGWEATVNGRPVRIHEVDGALRGVVVPAGFSRVRFRYAPRSVTVGATLTVAAFGGTSLLFAMAGYRRRSGAQARARSGGPVAVRPVWTL